MPVTPGHLCHGLVKAVAEAFGRPIIFCVIFLFIVAKKFTESRLLNSNYLNKIFIYNLLI